MSEPLFEESQSYDAMLARGLSITGEDRAYFARARVADLRARAPADLEPRAILDYGCGTGETAGLLAQAFPRARVLGVDTSVSAVRRARARCSGVRVRFGGLERLASEGPFDLVYCSGVLHHIDPSTRAAVTQRLADALRSGGVLAVYENNPRNPGTRWVMRRIPFDRLAVPLLPAETEALLRGAGLEPLDATHFLFYFPRPLAFLRALEPRLAGLPWGGQYGVLGQKP